MFIEAVDCVVVAELRKSLPDMVVEILQEKLDQELIEDVSRIPVMTDISDNTAGVRSDDGLNEFPKNWETMDENEVSWLLCNVLL